MRQRMAGVLVVLAACVGEPPDDAPRGGPVARRERGLVTLGAGGTYTLAGCDRRGGRAVPDSAGALAAALRPLDLRPGQVAYVELTLEAARGAEFLRAVHRAGPAVAGGCPDLPAGEVGARGQEPSWSVTLVGDSLVLEQPAAPARLAVAVTGPVSATGTRTWSSGPGAPSVTLLVVDAPCTDRMSGERFPYRVELVVDGTTRAGCGFDGQPAFAPAP